MPKATKLPSGKWRCRAYYTDIDGSYITKSFTADTKREAERLSATFTMEHEHNAKPANRTLGELADAYIENRSNLLSPTTVVSYKKIRRTAFQSIINVRVGNITKEMYQQALNEYTVGHAPKTVVSAHTFFHKILKENDIHVAENVNLPQKKKKEIAIPTTEELQFLLDKCKGTRLYLYCLLAITLGLRRSEIIGIQWKDINLDDETVSINKARVKDESKTYVVKQTKTTTSERIMRLQQVVIDALGKPAKPDDYVISESPAALESLYKRFTAKIGFPYNFHALRHYYASVMLINGVPNLYAKERMGHATENMLQRVYQHTFADKQKEYDTVMDNFMNTTFSEKE